MSARYGVNNNNRVDVEPNEFLLGKDLYTQTFSGKEKTKKIPLSNVKATRNYFNITDQNGRNINNVEAGIIRGLKIATIPTIHFPTLNWNGKEYGFIDNPNAGASSPRLIATEIKTTQIEVNEYNEVFVFNPNGFIGWFSTNKTDYLVGREQENEAFKKANPAKKLQGTNTLQAIIAPIINTNTPPLTQ
jgi:hypothetical protein